MPSSVPLRPWHLQHFSLNAEPFHPALAWPTDRRFVYHSRGWEEALARVQYVSENQFGVAILTGQPGVGKSLLLTAAEESLLLENYRPLRHICHPSTSAPAYPLGRASHPETRDVLAACLEGHPAGLDGEHRVLLLDNVDQMRRQRDIVHRLVECALQNSILGCLILCIPQQTAPNLFEDLVNYAPLVIRMTPLELWETGEYLGHRMTAAGGAGEYFHESAIERLHIHSRGVPRLLNRLAHETLLLAAVKNKDELTGEMVDSVQRSLSEFSRPTAAVRAA